MVSRAVITGDGLSRDNDPLHKLPSVAVVDLSRLCGASWSSELITPTSPEVVQIAEAARSSGFFQVVGHGIDRGLMNLVSLRLVGALAARKQVTKRP